MFWWLVIFIEAESVTKNYLAATGVPGAGIGHTRPVIVVFWLTRTLGVERPAKDILNFFSEI